MSAQKSPPLWKLPDLRGRGTVKTVASSIDSNSTSSSPKYSMPSETRMFLEEAAGGSPKQANSQDTSAIPRRIMTINPKCINPVCFPFASLRTTSLRLQSNEHTWDTLLLRFLRLEPGEVIPSPPRNHVVEIRARSVNNNETVAHELRRRIDQPRYFAIHLSPESNPLLTLILPSLFLPSSLPEAPQQNPSTAAGTSRCRSPSSSWRG